MKIEYHNLYTHFILITQNRIPFIPEKNRDRIEKYISALLITTTQGCIVSTQILSIPTFLFPGLQDYLEEVLATKVADSSSKFVNDNKLTHGQFKW
jgi:putative transposase